MVGVRILYFHQHFSTPQGSAGIRSYQMARRLIARGHSVTMVCGSYDQGSTGLTMPFEHGERRGTVDGIKVIELELSYSNKLGFAARANQFLRYAMRSARLAWSEPADIVFATSTPLTAAIPGIVAQIRGRPFVFEVRDLWPELPKAMGVIRNPVVIALLRALEWLGYRSADRLVGLSPGIVEGIRHGGGGNKPIAMIPNGCDTDLFDAACNRGEDARPPVDAHNPLLAVFTGTHGTANGLDAVLDAARVLQQRGERRILIVLIGDGKQKPALQARVVVEKISTVKFRSPVNKAELARIMAKADIGLQILANIPAFYYGTSPNKFFDYVAAGLPVLTNYPGWIADLVSEHKCGIAVPPDDAEAFADALQLLADRPGLLPAMSMHGAALARERFDRRTLADQWVDFVAEEPRR